MSGARAQALALLAALVLATYANSLEGGFHYDDFHSLVDNPHVRSLAHLPAFFADPQTFSRNPGSEMYRPLVLCSYALNYALGEYEAWGYHLFNIGAHLLVAFLLYALLLETGRGPGPALAGALFFAVHPLAAEPVNYVSSRSESLAALFALAALLLYARAGGRPAAAGLLAYGAGLLCKATALGLPLLLVAWERLGQGRGWRHCLGQWPYWVLSLVYVLGTGRLIREAVAEAPVRPLHEHALTQIKALLYYARLLFVPQPLTVEHQFSVSASAEGAVLGSLACLLSVVLLARRGGERWRWPLFWAAWIFLTLLPSLLVPLNVLVNERRLYMPLAGFAGLLACLGGALSARWWAVAGLGLLALLTGQRNEVWKSEESLWADARKKAPLMVRPHLRTGALLRQQGELERAEAAYARALELDPQSAAAHNNLGNLYRQMGREGEAEKAYARALEILPGYVEALVNMATLHSDRGRYELAFALYERALALSPLRADLHNNLGTALLKAGRHAEAEEALRRALELDPRSPGICFNLGGALEGQGRVLEALDFYRRAVVVDPAYAPAYYNIGLLEEGRGHPGEAQQAYERFLRHWRGDPRFAGAARERLQALRGGD